MFCGPVDLSATKVGDMLAVDFNERRWDVNAPTHSLLIVERETATQLICRQKAGHPTEWKFRKSDGKLIGHNYRYAEIATPELVAKVRQAQATQARFHRARSLLNDLDGKHLHQLKLSVEQLEALANAWTDIKAMKK